MINDILLNDLKNLGIQEGDTVFTHCSLKGLQYKITPKDIIDTLICALGNNGTLLMPSFSYINVTDENSHFDVNETPSCIGVIPEYFRTHFDVIRSVHPTHSVCAIGKNAESLTSNHHHDSTPVGPNSPISRLKDFSGKILMLGCGLKPSTFVHGAEEIAQVPYCLRTFHSEYTMVNYAGELIEINYQRHNFRTIEQMYQRIEDILPSTVLKSGKLLNGTGHLINHQLALPYVVNKLKNDTFFFVDHRIEMYTLTEN